MARAQYNPENVFRIVGPFSVGEVLPSFFVPSLWKKNSSIELVNQCKKNGHANTFFSVQLKRKLLIRVAQSYANTSYHGMIT